jgi:hypothetical protein
MSSRAPELSAAWSLVCNWIIDFSPCSGRRAAPDDAHHGP